MRIQFFKPSTQDSELIGWITIRNRHAVTFWRKWFWKPAGVGTYYFGFIAVEWPSKWLIQRSIETDF